MAIRLNISDDPNIYTIMDFLFVTEEHTAGDYGELLAQEEAEGHGFGFVYMSTVQKTVDSLQSEWSGRAPAFTTDWLIRTFAEFDRCIRAAVDQALQEYIFSHDGFIDSWPIPATEIGFSFQDEHGKTARYEFEYFGADYCVQKTGADSRETTTTLGRGKRLTYRTGCQLLDTDEYRQMMARHRITPFFQLSAEYRRIKQENEAHHQQQQSFADAWHRPWFEICDNFMSNCCDTMDHMSW